MNSGAHSLGWFLLAAEGVHIVIGSGHSTPTQHVGTRCNRVRAGYVGGRFNAPSTYPALATGPRRMKSRGAAPWSKTMWHPRSLSGAWGRSIITIDTKLFFSTQNGMLPTGANILQDGQPQDVCLRPLAMSPCGVLLNC